MKFLGKAKKMACINILIVSAGIGYSGKKWSFEL